MAMATGGGSGAMANINVTPLIDVLLVLIIIFLVITPLIPKGLDALVPQPPPPNVKSAPADTRTIVVSIGASGQDLKINQDPTSWSDLGPRLEDIYKNRAERVMFVKGEDDTLFEYVVRVIDVAKGAGVDKIGLITAKIQAGQ